MRGGERVLEELCRLFPTAPVYTFFHDPGSVSPTIEEHPIHVSALGRLRWLERHHRTALPLLPWQASRLRIAPCDLVISTSHCVAGSVRPPPGAFHLCVCFTPMRYIWGMQEAYVGRGPKRVLYELLASPLRAWDRRTASRVDRFVAISEFVRARIARAYGRDADLLYPPVDTERFRPAGTPEPYFLVVSALVPYKRIDLVLDSFQHRSEELFVAGDGPLLERYRSRASRNVRLLGFVDDSKLPELVARCRALIFPSQDEFGIAAVEAQAAGRPVIALGRGGATETVVPPDSGRKPTGVWFTEQTPQALARAVDQFQQVEPTFDPQAIRSHALGFSRERFRAELLRIVERLRPAEGIETAVGSGRVSGSISRA
jgi:glycosyltransferase involved in cell wall biosynthesis